jgi:hypothetical protein
MTRHWPFGCGDHARLTMLTGMAAILGTAALGVSVLWMLDNNGLERTDAASRLWTCVFFVAVMLEYTVRRLFHPRVLACLLPTPADASRLYELLDPERTLAHRLMLGGFALAAMAPLFPKLGTLHTLVGVLFAWSLFRLLAPLLVWAAAAWRKVLVPRGPYVVWAAALMTVGGLLARFPASTYRGTAMPFILDPISGWSWLGLALLFAIIQPVVRDSCHARAKALFRRDELMELAFATQVQPRGKPRRLVLESMGGGPRRRRFLLLVQEGLGLRRREDWWEAAGVAACVVGVLVVLGWAFGWTFGSGFHLYATLLPICAVVLWEEARVIVLRGGRLVNPLAAYALPVGQFEFFRARVVALSVMYFGLGFVLALALIPVEFGEQFPLERLGVGMVNLVHVWLLAVASWALVCLARGGAGSRMSKPVLCCIGLAVVFSVQFALMSPLLPPMHETNPWTLHLPNAARIAVFLYDAASIVASDPETFRRMGSMMESIPAWVYNLWAWVHAGGVFALSVGLLVRDARGRSHPDHGRCPLASRMPLFARIAGGR